MRKLIPVFLILILAVACTVPESITAGVASNPFIDAIDLTAPGVAVTGVDDGVLVAEPYGKAISSDRILFPLVTDVHTDRTDSGVTEFKKEFIDFLGKGDYPFVVCLGDLSDTGDYASDGTMRFIAEAGRQANGNFIYVIGNHERHIHDASCWDRFAGALVPEGFSPRMARYVFGPLSIYKLDNSTRIYGRAQLGYLETALAMDSNPYKIFITHINNTTGGVPDQSLFITGMADIAERNRICRLMDQYGVSLLLTGHHHKGNIAYRLGEHSSEFNAAALHRRDFMGIESEGYWYTVEIIPEEGIIRVIPYYAETGEALDAYEFPL